MQVNQDNQVRDLDVHKLEFDQSNPRLPSSMVGASEEEILRWMCEDGGILDLMRSIGEQGYFNGEPLLVTKSENSLYTVIEGNRRLAALKLLHAPDLIDYRRKTILQIVADANDPPLRVPCIVYDTRDNILEYLGYRHVTGIKSWSPLAKARYLHELSNSPKFSIIEESQRYRQLARVIGSRVDYVKRILAGLKLYDHMEDREFYGIDDLDEASIAFSLVTTALGHPGIVDHLGLSTSQDLQQDSLNLDHLEELTRWIFEKKDGRTRLGESRHFRELNRVVASDIALKEFRNDRTLQEALLYTDAPAETFRELLRKAKSHLQESQDQLYLVREGLLLTDKKLVEDIFYLTEGIEAILGKRLRRVRDTSPDLHSES